MHRIELWKDNYEDIVAVDSAYDDILAMSATLRDPAPAVSQLPVSLHHITEGYEVIHSAPSITGCKSSSETLYATQLRQSQTVV